jgi:hypothetical protein
MKIKVIIRSDKSRICTFTVAITLCGKKRWYAYGIPTYKLRKIDLILSSVFGV